MRTVLVIWFAVQSTAFGFLPPLTSIVHDVFDFRKGGPAIEIVFRHHIDLKVGDPVDLEERLVSERGQTLGIWKVVGQGPILVARWDGQGYTSGKDKIPSRSAIFIKYFTQDNPDNFRDALISEQFTRRDQWYQFKPGFTPEGDPQTWAIKDNYLRHDDIYLSRLPQGISIAVQGTDEAGNQKIVYFDRSLHGLSRLEWRQNGVVTAWNFETFSRRQGDGFYPAHATFESGGAVLVSTDVQSVRHLKDKQLADFNNTFKSAHPGSPSSTVSAALKALLSYR